MAKIIGEIVAAETLTITVRMPRAFGLRSWLVGKLFELAGVISAVPIAVELEESKRLELGEYDG